MPLADGNHAPLFGGDRNFCKGIPTSAAICRKRIGETSRPLWSGTVVDRAVRVSNLLVRTALADHLEAPRLEEAHDLLRLQNGDSAHN